jgi:hypothetical protein
MQCGSDLDHHPDHKCQALQDMLNYKQIQQEEDTHLNWSQGKSSPKCGKAKAIQNPLVFIIILNAELVIVM